MAFTTEDFYDECEPPVCPDDITLRIVYYPSSVCSGDEIQIHWVIDFGEGVVSPISSNALYWSFNNKKTFSNIESPVITPYAYRVIFNAPGEAGAVYFKAKALIKGIFYESAVYQITILDCDPALPPPFVSSSSATRPSSSSSDIGPVVIRPSSSSSLSSLSSSSSFSSPLIPSSSSIVSLSSSTDIALPVEPPPIGPTGSSWISSLSSSSIGDPIGPPLSSISSSPYIITSSSSIPSTSSISSVSFSSSSITVEGSASLSSTSCIAGCPDGGVCNNCAYYIKATVSGFSDRCDYINSGDWGTTNGYLLHMDIGGGSALCSWKGLGGNLNAAAMNLYCNNETWSCSIVTTGVRPERVAAGSTPACNTCPEAGLTITLEGELFCSGQTITVTFAAI